MKILHTSDWHLGRSLYGRRRYAEYKALLDWLAETIDSQAVDLLLVAGDIFDNSTPGNRSQTLYYRFLCRVAASDCRHVVIIAGNHDSPSFLDAPAEILKALNVHVIGAMTDNPEDEVIVLDGPDGSAELIVCAVPYLRDRDIRQSEAGEGIEDKERKLIEGIRNHYAAVVSAAQYRRNTLRADLPVIGMGHLFTAGGKIVDGDGVRELYVGSLAHVSAGIFPAGLDYLALGHLHVAQVVNHSETMRYSGSPLSMGFSESPRDKSICLFDISRAGDKADVELLRVPVFQGLERIKGNREAIVSRLIELAATDSKAWLEIIYEGEEVVSDLRALLEKVISGTKLEILRVQNKRLIDQVLSRIECEENLDDLDVDDVFERCLSAHDIAPAQRSTLIQAYREVVQSLAEDDVRAE